MQRTARWLPSHGSTSCGGDRWSRTAATTWRREDLVQRGGGRSCGGRAGGGDRWQTCDAEDGAAADTERSTDGGGAGAEFRRRAEVQVWWESDREGGGPCGLCAD
uniref:Uncharacterized protein n=1 Tax=Oryza barthii TaxID=65489 RepID=A0A0D3GIJ3_9ORYZ